MNKTNHIILILALCFSLAFVVYPLRTFAEDGAEFGDEYGWGESGEYVWQGIGEEPHCDSETYYGPCIDGKRLKEVSYPVCAGGGPGGSVAISEESCGGTTTPIKEKEKGWRCPCDGGGCREHISTSPQYSTLAQCEQNCPCGIYKYCNYKNKCEDALWRVTLIENECTTDAQCIIPIIQLPKYSCDTSTWVCYEDYIGPYSSLATCQANCVATPIPGGCPSGQTKPHRECR